MLASKENILRYIPQRPPMVMVDELLEASDVHAITRLEIRNENIFLQEEKFSEAGLVENMAQTAAAQLGYQCALKNIPVPIGYIAALKDLRISQLPRKGAVITNSIMITNQISDITIVEGVVEQERGVCFRCEMKIFVKNQS